MARGDTDDARLQRREIQQKLPCLPARVHRRRQWRPATIPEAPRRNRRLSNCCRRSPSRLRRLARRWSLVAASIVDENITVPSSTKSMRGAWCWQRSAIAIAKQWRASTNGCVIWRTVHAFGSASVPPSSALTLLAWIRSSGKLCTIRQVLRASRRFAVPVCPADNSDVIVDIVETYRNDLEHDGS
jgi:hypothetical protein